MKVSGNGHIPAGDYNDRISINGSCTLDGNVRCLGFSSKGSTHCTGSLECAEEIRSSGSIHIEGNAVANTLSVAGTTQVAGDLVIQNTTAAAGALVVNGIVKSGRLSCAGRVQAVHGIETQEFSMAGQVKCDGSIKADVVDIALDRIAKSAVNAVSCKEIRVYRKRTVGKGKRKKRRPLFANIRSKKVRLTVSDAVEGDVVALECVKAPKVVGRVVTIGAGCRIDLVQYRETCEVNPRAKVGRCEKI
ncbi:MAG: hypothetical protein IKU90_00195 [Clostridia bacterium]|nr:hypothetical protein [Clostridia bacterium]